jgi:amino acid adenylation domain-containing protein
VVLDAYSHQDLPFEKLVDELEQERDLSRSSLFQVMLTLQNTPRQDRELPGLTLAQLGIEATTAKFDLTMFVTEARQGLLVSLKYNTDLFEAATIERMLGHFQTLLEAVVQEPQTKLDQLSWLTSAEQQSLREWNDTASEYRRDVCLHEFFEEQVARTPEQEAVIFRDEWLTFAELNVRADELAQQLRRQGVGPEVRVALCMDRSLEMVVSVLAIWKAGGVYVPLDITQPQQRLELMLKDADVKVVLNTDHTDLSPESDPDLIRAFDPLHPRSTNLAYIIYTSGSTGTPKGVMVTHRSAVNLVHALQRAIYHKYQTPLRVSVNAQISFDASIKQLVQLLSGHTLVIIPEEVRASGPELLEHLTAQRVDVLDCTPSQLQLLLATESWQQASVPRLLLVGGESISTELWDRLAADTHRDYYNVYGPTECTVDATAAKVHGDTPNIGRPVANTRTYLLDKELQPVPAGVRGEICIAGECLARGYLNRPDLTAERFVPDAHSDEPGTRLYRTGDVARYRADGAIEFSGRLDDQVKVRGHRIELGEIEAVLSAHERVSEAVVLVHEERLAAYVVTEAEPAELHEYLQERLPEYMIPTAWVNLDALPLTTNGKVDRKALPALGLAQTAAAETYVAPRTPMEEMLASIWSELLRVERIGIHDNFFAIGGHSLVATQVITRVRSVFNIELPIRRLFEAPTIAGLAVAVVQEQASQVEDDEMAQIIAELEYLSDDDALSQVNH